MLSLHLHPCESFQRATSTSTADFSSFLPKPSKDSRVDDYETELGISALSTSDFSSYAHEWATTATREVLMQAIEPSLENVQACQVLTLYWFSKDARDHTHILTRKLQS
jgi:hypothetical protein